MHFLRLSAIYASRGRWRAEGLHNHGEISRRSWLAIVPYYVNFTTPHLHYAPTCELAHCNSRTRCQKLVLGIHKNESPFRSLLKSRIMNRGRRLPAFTCFRTVFWEKEQFSARAFFPSRARFSFAFSRNEFMARGSARYIAFRNCVRAKVSKSIIKRCRRDLLLLAPTRGREEGGGNGQGVRERSQRHVTSRICRLRRPICAIISHV